MMHTKVILVIDDDLEDQEVLMDALKEIDPSIVCLGFINGEEAIKLLKADAMDVPYLVFLDLNMPRFTGRQCLVELKQIVKLASTPIIIYSTSVDKKDIDETKNLGASFFLTKPSRFDELRKSLNHILSLKW